MWNEFITIWFDLTAGFHDDFYSENSRYFKFETPKKGKDKIK